MSNALEPTKDDNKFILTGIASKAGVAYQSQTGFFVIMGMTMQWLASLIILLYGISTAFADIRIDESRYQNGHTIITGETDPDLTVTVDNKYKTKSNGSGYFKFSIKYKPSTCMSDIKAGDNVYSAVISGCFDTGINVETKVKVKPVKGSH